MSLLEERMRHPLHHGPVDGANGVGAVGNPACGDVVTIHLRIENATIAAAGFESMGSVFQLATASVMCDCVIGESMADARGRTPNCVLEKLPDLPENKRYLGRLALEALQRALDNHERRGQGESIQARVMDAAEARAFVLELMSNGRQWGTLELDAMARADELAWPTSLARFLIELRKDGTIEGEMRGTSWRWWHPTHHARDAGHQ